jgi:hypothetical protein
MVVALERKLTVSDKIKIIQGIFGKSYCIIPFSNFLICSLVKLVW